jgi:putative ABC transport system permease protein
MNENKTLADDECFIYSDDFATQWDTFTIEHGGTYKVKERISDYYEDEDAQVMVFSCAYIVVSNMNSVTEPISEIANFEGDSIVKYIWQVGFDTETAEQESDVRDNVFAAIKNNKGWGDLFNSYYVKSREAEKNSFYNLYGSLFFLGIMLSSVFLIATVLIIYYKQISEGYEDQNRFEIMQKVGMTKKEIRKSINSQMLTVFFLPLIMAGVHLAFAFPVISKLLVAFSFNDTILNAAVTLVCFAVFGILYAVVYKITSGYYCAIVSGKKIAYDKID